MRANAHSGATVTDSNRVPVYPAFAGPEVFTFQFLKKNKSTYTVYGVLIASKKHKILKYQQNTDIKLQDTVRTQQHHNSFAFLPFSGLPKAKLLSFQTRR